MLHTRPPSSARLRFSRRITGETLSGSRPTNLTMQPANHFNFCVYLNSCSRARALPLRMILVHMWIPNRMFYIRHPVTQVHRRKRKSKKQKKHTHTHTHTNTQIKSKSRGEYLHGHKPSPNILTVVQLSQRTGKLGDWSSKDASRRAGTING